MLIALDIQIEDVTTYPGSRERGAASTRAPTFRGHTEESASGCLFHGGISTKDGSVGENALATMPET